MKTALLLSAFVLTVAGGNAAADATATGNHRHAGHMLAQASPATAYQASGIVKKSDAARGTATIAHGPIAALGWPAMTMTFKAKDNAVLAKLVPGRSVHFNFVKESGNYVITEAR